MDFKLMELKCREDLTSLKEQHMALPLPSKIRFEFLTQLPRDDGCGLVVAQMLTGRPYNEIAGLVEWGTQTDHYMSWDTVRDLLGKLDVILGESRPAKSWPEIRSLAFVHVEPDHYILYDADNGVFYDPGLPVGPDTQTSLVPIAYYPVRPPLAGTDS